MGDHTGHAVSMVEAFNNADWEAAKELIGNSTYIEHGTQRSLKGQDIIDAMQGWRAAMPDVRGTVTSATEDHGRAVIEVTWHGTHTGPLTTPDGEIPPSGRSQTTPGAWVFDFDGDELVESRHYFDMLTFLQQIGAA